jgi:voltage-gated sodium channel
MTFIRRSTLLATAITESHYFNNFIISIILFTSVLVGVQLDQKNGVPPSTAYLMSIFENFIYAVFAAEVVLRMAAEEFNLIEYFSNMWNVFDFIVVAISKLPGTGSRFVVILRLVRMLRVLKLIKSLPQLAVIVNALLIGLNSITYVGVLMFLMYYVFAIFAVLIFNGNDPFHFATLHMSLFSLFDIATLNNWGDIMYTAVYGCEHYPAFNTCDHSYAFGIGGALYFCFFIVVGSFVLLTLFVGVVTTSMEEASKIQSLERAMEDRAQAICNANHIGHKEMGIYRRVFGMLDLDGSGTIESTELRIGLGCLGIHPTEEELAGWIIEVDMNSDGVIDVVEFVTFMIAMKTRKMEAKKNGLDDSSSSSSDSSIHNEPLEPIAEEEEDEIEKTGRSAGGDRDVSSDIKRTTDSSHGPEHLAFVPVDIFAPYLHEHQHHVHHLRPIHLHLGSTFGGSTDLSEPPHLHGVSSDEPSRAVSCSSVLSSDNNTPRSQQPAHSSGSPENRSDKDRIKEKSDKSVSSENNGSDSNRSTPRGNRSQHHHGHNKEKRRHSHEYKPVHGHENKHEKHEKHGHHGHRPSFSNSITEGLAELTDMEFMHREPAKSFVQEVISMSHTATEGIEHELGHFSHSLARITHTAADNLGHLLAQAAANVNGSTSAWSQKSFRSQGDGRARAGSNSGGPGYSNRSSNKSSVHSSSTRSGQYDAASADDFENEDAVGMQNYAAQVEESIKLAAAVIKTTSTGTDEPSPSVSLDTGHLIVGNYMFV